MEYLHLLALQLFPADIQTDPPKPNKRVILKIPHSLAVLAFSDFSDDLPLPPIISCILHKIYKTKHGPEQHDALGNICIR